MPRRLVLLLVVGAALAGIAVTARAAARPAAPCPPVAVRVLPAWARTGFSDPRPRMPYVLGRRARIVAILFGTPLASPPAADRNNKILWVARTQPTPGAPLRIEAQRLVGAKPRGAPVSRVLDLGPGPSIVDLPRAGCWRFTLRWSGRVDALDLRYVDPRR